MEGATKPKQAQGVVFGAKMEQKLQVYFTSQTINSGH
jgi:hypothetical protein